MNMAQLKHMKKLLLTLLCKCRVQFHHGNDFWSIYPHQRVRAKTKRKANLQMLQWRGFFFFYSFFLILGSFIYPQGTSSIRRMLMLEESLLWAATFCMLIARTATECANEGKFFLWNIHVLLSTSDKTKKDNAGYAYVTKLTRQSTWRDDVVPGFSFPSGYD